MERLVVRVESRAGRRTHCLCLQTEAPTLVASAARCRATLHRRHRAVRHRPLTRRCHLLGNHCVERLVVRVESRAGRRTHCLCLQAEPPALVAGECEKDEVEGDGLSEER